MSPPVTKRPSSLGHKRSFGIHRSNSTYGEAANVTKTIIYSTPPPSTATRDVPVRQKSQNEVPLVCATMAKEDEREDHLGFNFEDPTPHPLRVVNIPDPSQLQDIPGSEDEAVDIACTRSTQHGYATGEGDPALAMMVFGGKHHEVWDPGENEFYAVKGRIMFWGGLCEPLQRDSRVVLHSFLLQVRSQIPRARIRWRDGKQESRDSTCLLAETIATVGPPRKAPNGPRNLKSEKVKDEGNATTRHFTSEMLQVAPNSVPESRLTVELSHVSWGSDHQFAEFKAVLPVGTATLEGSGSSTRFFTIEAKAVCKQVAVYRKIESKELEFSVTILKKNELMDGRKTTVEVNSAEEKRRALLRTY